VQLLAAAICRTSKSDIQPLTLRWPYPAFYSEAHGKPQENALPTKPKIVT
jgi:hypothetical protein